MVERSGLREMVLGNLQVPEGATRCTPSLSLKNNGKELCLEVRYLPADHVAWNPQDNQFIDQDMGQDDNAIQSFCYSLDIASRFLDIAVTLERENRQTSHPLENRVVHFRSGSLGRIEVVDETVFLNYIPLNLL